MTQAGLVMSAVKKRQAISGDHDEGISGNGTDHLYELFKLCQTSLQDLNISVKNCLSPCLYLRRPFIPFLWGPLLK